MPRFRLPSFNSLGAFEAAARHQSIKKACDELHVNHAAVSRQIKNLELKLGRRLFERTHRRVVLTDGGELLFGAVTAGFSHIQRALTQLSRGEKRERFVISVDPDFAALWLVPRLAEFYAIVPDTLVEIVAEKTSLSLQDPRISCAIQYAEAGRAFKNCDLLFRSRLFPVCAKGLRQLAPLESLDDLRHHVLLHDRSTIEWEQFIRNCPTRIDINLKLGVIFSDTAHCLDAAARGQGVAIGDDFLAAMHLSEGRLVKAFGSSVLSENAYYFVVPESARRHSSVNAFRAWLLQSIERQRNDLDAHLGGKFRGKLRATRSRRLK
jgi:LysR family transcriptional regulator, glycine cleavage system transcriptional activator